MESDKKESIETEEEPKLIQDIEHAHPEIKLIEGERDRGAEVKREKAPPPVSSRRGRGPARGGRAEGMWEKLKRIFKR